ncbi:hypothetical protein [Candidatus Enterococcus mansonii]|uniref:Uncharacterized protein n=1 Tax=Candidatus Enterococcus mansonii TaxID=1834181 RepID=A0ABU8ICH6_9ENTE
MFVLFACLLISFMSAVSVKTGTIRNLITIFGVFWLIMIVISKYLSPMLFDVTKETYMLIYTFVTMVSVGFLLVSKSSFKYKMNVMKAKNILEILDLVKLF